MLRKSCGERAALSTHHPRRPDSAIPTQASRVICFPPSPLEKTVCRAPAPSFVAGFKRVAGQQDRSKLYANDNATLEAESGWLVSRVLSPLWKEDSEDGEPGGSRCTIGSGVPT